MEELVDEIVQMVLEQAVEIAELDGPRAEAWASDLSALAREALGPDGLTDVVERLVATGGSAAVAALIAIDAISAEVRDDTDLTSLGAGPRWAGAAGTSTCVEAFEVSDRRGRSLAFRFVDAAEVDHIVVIDIEATAPESVGEIQVAEGDLLDVVAEEGSGLEARSVSISEAARRVAEALAATQRPRPSAVVNGQLLVARLGPLTNRVLEPPTPVDDPVPPPPERDPDDAAYAIAVFDRALGTAPAPLERNPEIAEAGARLRADAERRGRLARWLEAAGPVDLDRDDPTLVIAAIGATIAPRTLVPLDPPERDAARMLEWADWLGALIELCREGPGAATDPSTLVDRVNRCPEITTTIPPGDRPAIEWAFSVMTGPWPELAVAADGCLTEAGPLLLPAAVHAAWALG